MALTGQHWQQPIRAKAGKGELNRALGDHPATRLGSFDGGDGVDLFSWLYPSCSCKKIPKQCRSSDDCMVWLTSFRRSGWINPGCVKAVRAAERSSTLGCGSAQRTKRQGQR